MGLVYQVLDERELLSCSVVDLANTACPIVADCLSMSRTGGNLSTTGQLIRSLTALVFEYRLFDEYEF